MSRSDLGDARQFAVDLHVPERRFGILPVTDELIERAAFLDTRLPVPFADAVQVPAADVGELPRGRLAWIFHTSFCASTLLARALHVAPHVALKEPLVLRRLADARKSGWPLEGLLEPTVALLGRPWHPGGAVIVKPTHVALNLATSLLAASPESRAVILTSTLEDFLLSNLKNTAESQAKIPLLVERALAATTFGARLGGVQPPDLVCAAGIQWAAQRELVLDVTMQARRRIRIVRMTELLEDIPAGVVACAEWLQLPVSREALVAHAAAVASRHAKASDMPFSPDHRVKESAHVATQYGAALASARKWLDVHVLPVMRDSALT